MARPMPVLPLVASITVWPGFSLPVRSASSMTPSAKRSLTEPSGLKASILTNRFASGGASLPILTTGVFPTVSRIFANLAMPPPLQCPAATGRHSLVLRRLGDRDRRLAPQHQPIKVALLVHVVIRVGLVEDAAVVPHHHVAIAPLVPVFVFRLRRMRHQLSDEVERLVVGHADDPLDAHGVQEQGLAAVL